MIATAGPRFMGGITHDHPYLSAPGLAPAWHDPRMTGSTAELAVQGETLLAAGQWEDAERLLRAAVELDESPRLLDTLGRVLYCMGAYDEALDWRERAFSGYRADGDDASAAATACWLSYLQYTVYGNDAAANGWVNRARTLLGNDTSIAEHALVSLFLAFFSPDAETKIRILDEVLGAAREAGDASLEALARCDMGVVLVEHGQIAEGMSLLDEAAAAAASGEVTHIETAGVIFCNVLQACELARDTRRARQWLSVQADQSRRRGVGLSTSIHCRTYYGGILTAAGRWAEAEHELEALTRGYTNRYRGFSSAVVVRLAELRVLQGRLEEAARLLEGHEDDPQAVRPLARLYAARGELALAASRLRRHLELYGDGVLQAPEIALLVEVEAAAGQLGEARRYCEHLATLAETSTLQLVHALAEYAAGTVCGVDNVPEAVSHLERALAAFVALELPYEEGRTRLRLGRHLATTNPDVAVSEVRMALARFEELNAVRDADEAASVLRELGASGRAQRRRARTLTAREQEVLQLITEGLSNDDIAERLVISRRTAEHHVSNILEKLGLRNRTEAAAYALRAASPRQ
jgi:DNA-binding CsgD family transcriptional regulator/predicted negative regulator of RcsB-dependent stress response